MSSTDSQEALEILEQLDMHISCDVGHPGGIGHTDLQPCQREADYTLNYHSCPGVEAIYGTRNGYGHGTWCSFHLAQFTTSVQARIRNAEIKGETLKCLGCKQLYQSIPDVIWNVTPIR